MGVGGLRSQKVEAGNLLICGERKWREVGVCSSLVCTPVVVRTADVDLVKEVIAKGDDREATLLHRDGAGIINAPNIQCEPFALSPVCADVRYCDRRHGPGDGRIDETDECYNADGANKGF